MLLVILNTPQGRLRFDRRCAGKVLLSFGQMFEKLAPNTYLVDETGKTLYLILQEMKRDRKTRVYKISEKLSTKQITQMLIDA